MHLYIHTTPRNDNIRHRHRDEEWKNKEKNQKKHVIASVSDYFFALRRYKQKPPACSHACVCILHTNMHMLYTEMSGRSKTMNEILCTPKICAMYNRTYRAQWKCT